MLRVNLMLRISAGFAYSLKCPVKNFTESNEKCYGRYIQRQMLDFKSDNDLIASGSSGNITKACRSVRNLSYNFFNKISRTKYEKMVLYM